MTPTTAGRSTSCRELLFVGDYLEQPGTGHSVLQRREDEIVLCTAIVGEGRFRAGSPGKGRGWMTAEYSMLPASTASGRSARRREADRTAAPSRSSR